MPTNSLKKSSELKPQINCNIKKKNSFHYFIIRARSFPNVKLSIKKKKSNNMLKGKILKRIYIIQLKEKGF